MTDLDDRPDPMLSARLTRHLERSADDVAVRSTPVSAILRRADRRRRNHRLTAMLGAASLLVITAAGAIASSATPNPSISPSEAPTVSEPLSSLPASTVTVPASTPPLAPPAPSTSDDASTPSVAPLASPEEQWRSFEPDTASRAVVDLIHPSLGMSSGHVTWTFDEQSPPNFRSEVFISSDGVSWTPTPVSPGLAVLGGTESEGRIDLVGYVPIDEPGAGSVVLATSTDAGASWVRQDLGYDIGAAWSSGLVDLRLAPSEVVRRGDVVIATVGGSSSLDIDAIAGDGTMAQGYVIEEDGVAVLAPCEPGAGNCFSGPGSATDGREVERRISWEAAGLDPTERALLDPEPVIVRAEEGGASVVLRTSSFASGTRLGATDESFLALVQSDEPVTQAGQLAEPASLLVSADGSTWDLVGRPPIQIGAVGMVGDQFVASGPDLVTGDNIVVASQDGRRWTELVLPPDGVGTSALMPYGATIARGRIALLEIREQPALMVRMNKNGVVVEAENGFGDMVVYDETTGAVIGGWTNDGGYTGNVRRGEGASFVVTSDDGDVIATFTLEEATAALQEQGQEQEAVLNVLVSDDLASWSRTSLNQLTDEPAIWAEVILVTHDGWAIPAQVGSGEAPERRILTGVRL